MTAEEKLKELYDNLKYCPCGERDCGRWDTDNGYAYISPEHIDLIANLVVERLRNGGI